MTIEQMHISFDLEYEKLNIQGSHGYNTQQIDLLFNTVIRKMVSEYYSSATKEVELNFRSLSNLNTLIVAKTLPLVVTGQEADVELPPDFKFYLSSDTTSIYNCKTVHATAATTVNYYVIPKTAWTSVEDIKLSTAAPLTLFDGSLYSAYVDTVTVPEEFNLFILFMISRIHNQHPTLRVYWERWRDVFAQDSLIIVDYSATLAGLSIDVEVATVSIATITVSTKALTNYVVGVGDGTITSPNRISETQYINRINPFNKTKYECPLGSIFDNKLKIYFDTTFFPVTTNLRYVRQPAIVNYLASVDCDLPIHTHEEVVTQAALYAKNLAEEQGVANALQFQNKFA